MQALQTLDLSISAEDRVNTVIREGKLSTALFHQFACQCAEHAVLVAQQKSECINDADKIRNKSVIEAIEAKHAWLCGEIDDISVARAGWKAGFSKWHMAEDSATESSFWAVMAIGKIARWEAWQLSTESDTKEGRIVKTALSNAAQDSAYSAEREYQITLLRVLIAKEEESRLSLRYNRNLYTPI